MTVEIVQEYAKTLTVVIAALAAVGGAIAWTHLRLIRPVIKAIEAIHELVEFQLRANGGSSLVDKVNRIDGNHQEAERHWRELERTTDAINNRLDKIDRATANPKEVPDDPNI